MSMPTNVVFDESGNTRYIGVGVAGGFEEGALIGDSPTNLQRIWFTFNDSSANSGTCRLDVVAGSFLPFKDGYDLDRIAFDFKRDPRIGDGNGNISVLGAPDLGVKMAFPSKTVDVAQKNMEVE